jgi:hypothetical protein
MTTVYPDTKSLNTRRRLSGCTHWLPACGAVRTPVRHATTFVFILLTLTACNPNDGPVEDTLAYRSIWVELYPNSLRQKLSQDTLEGAFYFAAAAESQAAAEERWAKFLSAWTPVHGEFEDGMHANLVTWAELEMQRLQYMKQKKQSAMRAVSDKLRKLGAEFE